MDPLPMTAEKKVLFQRLGLSERKVNHEALHRKMLEEACAGRDRLSYNSNDLTEDARVFSNTQPLYKWDELSEIAKQREIANIARTGGAHTRLFYEYGRYEMDGTEGNWVVRWYLWHAFQYRDNRDSRSREPPRPPGIRCSTPNSGNVGTAPGQRHGD